MWLSYLQSEASKTVPVVVLDMAAIVHMVRPTIAKRFDEYVTLHMLPFIRHEASSHVKRIDAVRDTYPDKDNLKSLTHQRIGDDQTSVPKHDWN